MSIAAHLTGTMNNKYVQEIIARSSLQRDVSLVRLEELLTRHTKVAGVGIALLDIDRVAAVKSMGAAVKLELIDAMFERLAGHLPQTSELLWMGNDEFMVLNSAIAECQHFEAWLRSFVSAGLAVPFRLRSAPALGTIPVSVRGAFGIINPRVVTSPDIYMRGVLGSRQAKLAGPGTLIGLAPGQIESIRFEVPAMLAELVRALSVEQGRTVDDVAVEALEGVLRRYHR